MPRAQTPFPRTGSGADERREGKSHSSFRKRRILPSKLETCLQTWDSLEPKAKKAGSHAGHAYGWAKRYAVVMSGEQPVGCSSSRIRRPLARKQLEATPRSTSSSVCLTRAQPLRICTQCIWLAFTVQGAGFLAPASAKFGKSIPGWAVLLLAETCPGDCKRRGTGARVCLV